MPLAVSSYTQVRSLADGPDLLNLAWTLDERSLLSVDLDSVVGSELTAEVEAQLSYVNSYFVKDPYGEEELRPSVAAFFKKSGWSACVMCGAGVNSLLHALARFALGQTVSVVGETYPDFPFWVDHAGGRCIARTAEDLMRPGAHLDSTLVFMERPSLVGETLSDLADLEKLSNAVARRGTLIVIDESNANYCPPAFSAVHLVERCENIIVLRGFSKAYGMGGLRLAYCVASSVLRARLCAAIPPLQSSSLSLRLGRKILGLGDLASGLRERIRANKEKTLSVFDAAAIRALVPSNRYLPYLLLSSERGQLATLFESRGILGKSHPLWRGTELPMGSLYRMSVPLSEHRMDLFLQKMKTMNRCDGAS